jgi:DNA-binding response OmpR family regulator
MTVDQQTRALSVLIVEDNADTAESLARFLRLGCGYDVSTAWDGVKGIRAALDHNPDVIVCDIGLPKRDGLQVAEELSEQMPRRPLMIAVTGYGNRVTRDQAMAAGFDHFLVKPANPFEIEALIEAYAHRDSESDSDSNP